MNDSIVVWQWGRRGSGPKIALELAKGLSRHNNIRVLVTMSRQAENFQAAAASGIRLLAIDTYRGPISAISGSLRLAALRRKLRRAIENFGATSIIVVMPHLWDSFVLPIARAAGCRIITIVHDAENHPGDPYSYPLRRWLLQRELDESDRVITLTNYVADRLSAVYRCPRERISVIPHGVFRFGDAPIRRRQLSSSTPFQFLFFGRLLAYKGLDGLLKSLDYIDPSLSYEIRVAGAGDPGPVLSALKRHPRIRLDHRWIREEEIAAMLDHADAVVLPYIEASQSGVVAAAIGAGLPVIATPVGGLTEQIEPYHVGLVSEDATPRGFAAAMSRVACDAGLYARCVEGTVRAAEGPLAWEAVAKRFIEVCAATRESAPAVLTPSALNAVVA